MKEKISFVERFRSPMSYFFNKAKKILCILVLLLIIPASQAAANLAVTAFACNPNEVVANDQFSCTATV